MSVTSSTHTSKQQFGRRKDFHRIIFAKGDQVTSFTIHPVFAIAGVAVALILAIAYLGATGYLMFRDDLLNASRIHQTRIQNAYEDQLATLRIEIDRITSRQMLDQKSVENKLDRLLGLRASLDERQRAVSSLAQSANAAGITIPVGTPNPRPHPNRQRQASTSIDYRTSASTAVHAFSDGFGRRASNAIFTDNLLNETPEPIDFNSIEQRLQNEQRTQAYQLRLMARKTVDKAKSIASIIRSLGFKATTQPPHSAESIGGPFETINDLDPVTFGSSVLAIEENIAYLATLKKKVQRLPIGRPLKTGAITSKFGTRIDPFLGRQAHHSGMDFKAQKGTAVFATGPGKVVNAGWKGGYGRLVEIEHTSGLHTRYAHLSRIHVKKGDNIATGTVVGRVGSTGRSTGPHLHYETRLGETAINPQPFLKAGSRIHNLL